MECAKAYRPCESEYGIEQRLMSGALEVKKAYWKGMLGMKITLS